MNCPEIEDKNDINFNKETHYQQIFTYKPSTMSTMKGKSNSLFHTSKYPFSQQYEDQFIQAYQSN